MATVLAVLGSFGAVVGMALPAYAAGETVVSVTFDDGNADQLAAAQTMANKGLKGTFYIISGVVGTENYLTQANIATIAGQGHEIGGHTVSHVDLATADPAEATRQVCNDRTTLTNWGYNVTSFAYPFASQTAAAQQIVKDCGYNSARGLGDLKTAPGTPCADCAVAETIPPANPYLTAAADQVTNTWTVDDMKKWVTDAEAAGGGWVQLTFHHVCATGNTCGFTSADPTTSAAQFDEFTTWLAAWQDGSTKQVKTVNEVIGGAVQPVVPGAAITPPAGAGVNGVVNSGFETVAAGQPTCWYNAPSGANTPVFTTETPGRTGAYASKVTVSNYTGGDAKVLQVFDGSACSPSVEVGQTYSMRAWYKSTAATQFAVYYRTGTGAWQYWTSSPKLPASATYTQAVYTTPPIPTLPAGISGISFGLNLTSNGELVSDDYELFNTVGAPAVVVPTTPAAREGGADRFATSALVSSSFPTNSAVAYIASGSNYPDALSGAAAAGFQDGPVLLVHKDEIPAVVSAELARLAPQRIVVLGGTEVISNGVESTLNGIATTTRIGGADRFETSAKVSATFNTNAPVAYIASGSNYPDALSGAAAAGFGNGPVLLVHQNEIPTSIAAELTRLAPQRIVVLGGTTVISSALETALKAYSSNTTRLGGADRFETSSLVSGTFTAGVPVAYVASGSNYPDALSGAAAAGSKGGPVLLVHQNEIPASVAAELDRLNPARIVVLGGTTVISDTVQQALGKYVQ
jgi:putative cell wall-binding protein